MEMTPEERKELDERFARATKPAVEQVAQELRAACEDCKGMGIAIDCKLCNQDINYCMGSYCQDYEYPCPTCTPRIDKLMALAERLCWHTIVEKLYRRGELRGGRCNCGINLMSNFTVDCHLEENPRFTVAEADGYISIVDMLVLMGVLDEFISVVYSTIKSIVVYDWNTHGAFDLHDSSIFRLCLAEILTTTPLLQEAVISFLEGR
jgi:hypothetical protein